MVDEHTQFTFSILATIHAVSALNGCQTQAKQSSKFNSSQQKVFDKSYDAFEGGNLKKLRIY